MGATWCLAAGTRRCGCGTPGPTSTSFALSNALYWLTSRTAPLKCSPLTESLGHVAIKAHTDMHAHRKQIRAQWAWHALRYLETFMGHLDAVSCLAFQTNTHMVTQSRHAWDGSPCADNANALLLYVSILCNISPCCCMQHAFATHSSSH